MTSISGYRVMASPCCGSRFVAPRYASMNYSAHEYWTDGQCVQSLAPTDGGLRQCECDAYFLLRNAKEVIEVSAEERQATEAAIKVADEKLASLLALTLSEAVELVVRRRYWRYLNDPYREIYRAHRKSVDDAVREANKGAKTFLTALSNKITTTVPPTLPNVVTVSKIFTAPSNKPSAAQQENMQALLRMLLKSEKPDPVEVAELHRELGDYDAALKAIEKFEGTEHTASLLVRLLIAEKVNEPMRYVT
jgi:hypothetical protein